MKSIGKINAVNYSCSHLKFYVFTLVAFLDMPRNYVSAMYRLILLQQGGSESSFKLHCSLYLYNTNILSISFYLYLLKLRERDDCSSPYTHSLCEFNSTNPIRKIWSHFLIITDQLWANGALRIAINPLSRADRANSYVHCFQRKMDLHLSLLCSHNTDLYFPNLRYSGKMIYISEIVETL